MQRIHPKPLKKYPWYVKAVFQLQKRKYGDVLESAKLWARSPNVFLGLSIFFKTLDRTSSPISPQLRSLIFIHVSKMVKCPFCMDINSALYIERKGGENVLKELGRFETSQLFSKKEKTALKYAEAIAQTPTKVTDTLFADLREYFTEDEIVELTALIAFQNCSSRFNAALNIPSQEFYQKSCIH